MPSNAQNNAQSNAQNRWCVFAEHRYTWGEASIVERWAICTVNLYNDRCVCRAYKYRNGRLRSLREQLRGYNTTYCSQFLPTAAYQELCGRHNL